MLKQESNDISSGENNRARPCDTCRSNASTVYCHADSAYLCMRCDAEVHSANRVASRHKRVRVCESCERYPAAFLCEADDASLCIACDSEVHSANPLARRHQRVPILPISGNNFSSMTTHHQSETTMADPQMRLVVDQERGEEGDEDAKEVASWLFPNSDKNNGHHNNNNQNNELLFSDEYLNLADYNSSMDYRSTGQYDQQQENCTVPQTSYGGDRVVPLRLEESRGHLRNNQQNLQFDTRYGSSGSHYNENSSLNHNAHILSMEDVVPESTARDTTASYLNTQKGTIDRVPDPSVQMPTQLTPMDREARVLRYREKKKTRKFEKTIRYASRQAYAERRPRVNGRFAKREEIEDEDNRFNAMLMNDTGYGVVPSFWNSLLIPERETKVQSQ